ncbi:MAG: type VI secretion system protein TssA [Methylococcales bacterium]
MAIDINEYLDIDPDKVCGDDLQYDPAFIELEQAVKGKEELQMGDVKVDAEPPDWREVKKQSEALLLRTIDLRVLICYLRALIALEGFQGLQVGLTLIKTAVENRWESIHPLLDPDDDNDPTERVNVLMSLCDYDTVLRPLQQTPVIESKLLGRFNFREINIASGKATATSTEKELNQATIDAAVQDSNVNELQQTFKALSISLEQLNQLEKLITDQVGISEAPSFLDLRVFLKESKAFLLSALELRGGEDAISPGSVPAEQVAVVAKKSGSGVINNNQDVIKTLNLVCDYYKVHEPSSPVPLLINRAIRLVGKSFMDTLKDIAPAGIDEASVILGKQHEDNE